MGCCRGSGGDVVEVEEGEEGGEEATEARERGGGDAATQERTVMVVESADTCSDVQ